MEKDPKPTPEEQLAKTAERLMEEGVCAAAIHFYSKEANRYEPPEVEDDGRTDRAN